MEALLIKATKLTPEISFDANSHILEIKGESYPENTTEFYQPVFEWLSAYLAQLANEQVTVNIELFYFNSSSTKTLINFFDVLEEAATRGKNIQVNWIYESDDEDMLEFGEEFKEDLSILRFNFIEKEVD